MGKEDVKSAYRIIPVNSRDRYLLGMHWKGKYYVDLILPIGLRFAPRIFNNVADLFEWIFIYTVGASKISCTIWMITLPQAQPALIFAQSVSLLFPSCLARGNSGRGEWRGGKLGWVIS